MDPHSEHSRTLHAFAEWVTQSMTDCVWSTKWAEDSMTASHGARQHHVALAEELSILHSKWYHWSNVFVCMCLCLCEWLRWLQFLLCVSHFVLNAYLSLKMQVAAYSDNDRIGVVFLHLCCIATVCMCSHAFWHDCVAPWWSQGLNNHMTKALEIQHWELISLYHFNSSARSKSTQTSLYTYKHTNSCKEHLFLLLKYVEEVSKMFWQSIEL